MREEGSIYAAQAKLSCTECGGKIAIGIPRDKVEEEEESKLTEMPALDDPRWEVILSSCTCCDA